jgi:hypothetical protein
VPSELLHIPQTAAWCIAGDFRLNSGVRIVSDNCARWPL